MKQYLPYSWLLFFLSLLFIVYGSLLPLDFTNLNFFVGFKLFINILQEPEEVSRSDFAINILITIPLSFTFLSLLYRYFHKYLFSILATNILICLFISFSVEFAQIFTSGRVPSRSDVIAQFIGIILGMLIWLFKGQLIAQWFQSWTYRKEKRDFYEKALWLYIVFLFVYNILPFDLITSPAELYHKWEEGRVQLVPFIFTGKESVLILYQFITDILIWLPVSLLWILSQQKTPREALLWTVTAAIALELLQLLVYSRYTDITDIITAIIGAASGLWLSRFFLHQAKKEKNVVYGFFLIDISFVLLFLWSLLLLAIYWYPYSFYFESNFIRSRLEFVSRIPLLGYLNSAPFVALTTMLQKLLLFAPLGVLNGIIHHYNHSVFIKFSLILWSIFLVSVLEFVQILIPERTPDTSDIALGLLSIWLGYWCVQYFLRHGNTQNNTTPSNEQANFSQDIPNVSQNRYFLQKNSQWIVLSILIFQISSFLVLIQILTHIEQIPYNVRELFSQSSLWQHFLFISAVLICVLMPLMLVGRLRKNAEYMYLIYPSLLLISVIVFFLLFFSVPEESIYDIIGGPTLLWSWNWDSVEKFAESIGRFAVLYSSVFWCLVGAYCLNNKTQKKMMQAFYIWILLTPVIFSLSHYIIIIEAGTDNITELMRSGGGWVSSALIFILLFVLFYSSNLIGLSISGIKKITLKPVFIVLLSIPLSYLLAIYASEPMLFKYDSVFSALQFLLSPDRKHYLPQDKIFAYYILAYTIVLFSIIWFQLLYWFDVRFNSLYVKNSR